MRKLNGRRQGQRLNSLFFLVAFLSLSLPHALLFSRRLSHSPLTADSLPLTANSTSAKRLDVTNSSPAFRITPTLFQLNPASPSFSTPTASTVSLP